LIYSIYGFIYRLLFYNNQKKKNEKKRKEKKRKEKKEKENK
jgi:hypothetical protein